MFALALGLQPIPPSQPLLLTNPPSLPHVPTCPAHPTLLGPPRAHTPPRPPLPPPPHTQEARAAGIDVAAIIASRGLELHYSEFGLGGGQSPTGRTPARTADQVARTPFYGVNGPYRKSADPWQNPEVGGWFGVLRGLVVWLDGQVGWVVQEVRVCAGCLRPGLSGLKGTVA